MNDQVKAIIIESVIFSAWLYLFRANRNHGKRVLCEENIILLYALPVTMAMEIINECWTRYAYYPQPFLRVPGFNFPAAILLGGGLVTCCVFVAARGLAAFLTQSRGWGYYIIRSIIFLVMVGISWPIEFVFTRLGYWRYYHFYGYSPAHLTGVYLYYLFYAAGTIVLAKLSMLLASVSCRFDE